MTLARLSDKTPCHVSAVLQSVSLTMQHQDLFHTEKKKKSKKMQNLFKIQTALRFKDFKSVLTSTLQSFSQFLTDFINPVLQADSIPET